MGKREFKTLIKGDHNIIRKEYVAGKISGISRVLCDCESEKEFAMTIHNDGPSIIIVKCTKRRYEKFAKIVESLYPGLCVFDCGKMLV